MYLGRLCEMQNLESEMMINRLSIVQQTIIYHDHDDHDDYDDNDDKIS